MEVATHNLIHAIEAWRIDESSQRLVLAAGAHGPYGHLAEGRSQQSFAKGEGAIGAAWQQGLPIAQRLAGQEANNGHAVPYTCELAIPAMQNGKCRGVISLLCGDSDNRQGGFEVWRPNERGELALTDSWYANLERFGLVSSHVKFPRRAGLPGKVWSDRFPRVMGALGDSSDFVRVAGAKTDGLSMALGIPLMRTARELDAVLVMLSASQSPLARVMEVWAPDPETKSLQIVSADYGAYVDLATTSRRRRLRPGEGLAGRVFEEQAPWVTTDLLGVEFPNGEKLCEYGFEWGAGLPVFVGEDLFAVVTLLQ